MWVLLAVILAQSVDYSAEGLKALDAQRYDAAVEMFTKAVAEDPKDYGARFNLALSYSFLGKFTESIPQYKAVLELKPGLYEAELNLGISLLRSKDAAAAAVQLKAAVDQKPKEFRPVYYLAEALRDSGSLSEAEAAYTTAVSLKPDFADAEWALAQTMMGEKKLADSEPHFRKAAALNVKYKSYLLELASLLEADHQTEKAIALYREFPEDPAAREHMGALLLASGDPAAAVASLEAAVAKSPTAPNRVALAQAYLMTKQDDKALAVTSQLVAAEPQAYDVRMFAGKLLLNLHKIGPAANQFAAAAKIKPDSVEAWRELSAALVINQNYAEGIAALDRLRALGVETSGQLFFRALSYDHLHQLKDALAAYNKFLEASQGKNPDEEFKARQRARIIQHELDKR
ncbi:MAG TPA: tetratricopeptide repeat protein [Bryobacteraceae bacterium]|jgi:tetratricopeptide (TPR) repeat protein|nr:tetratricopeptide repeat protein [Bryobacteraceae bacterium]